MIAKLGQWRFASHFGQTRTRPAAAPCNDNHPIHRVDAKPMRRHILVGHWRVQPRTGVLECVWQTQSVQDPVGARADEDPDLCRLTVRGPGSCSGFVSRDMAELRWAA